jgi:hypothetical protein
MSFVKCPKCGGRASRIGGAFVCYACRARAASEVAAFPETMEPPVVSAPSPMVAVGRVPGGIASSGKPRFEPRQYPATAFLMWACYGLAGLTGVSLVGSTIMLVAALAGGAVTKGFDGPGEAASVVIGLVLLLILNAIAHAFVVLAFVALAEGVKLALDIQANTQEAAYNSRN